jgi:hypothetical protein
MHQRITVQSAYGPLEIAFTRAGHAYVSTLDNNTDEQYLTYRDKPYRVSVHVFADADWGVREGDDVNRPRITKAWGTLRYDYRDNAAPTVHAAILAEVVRVAKEAAKAHADLIQKAEVEAAELSLSYAREEVAKARKALEEAKAEERACQVRSDKALAALVSGRMERGLTA